MRYRSLSLFALTAGLAVLLGDLGLNIADAQVAKVQKKNKKAAKIDTTPTPVKPVAEVEVPTPPTKPLPTVIPAPMTKNAAAVAKLIDAEVNKKLADAKITPSPRSSDDEFLRRVYLDITGVIPSVDKAQAFLDSTDPDKRSKLIDELLTDPNYGRRMADIWTAKLFPIDSANRFVLKEPFYKWFETEFNKNVGWDKLVTSLVTATGEVGVNPAVTYFLSNRSVDKLTDTTGQHFMGIQLQCAQCHNHPFTSWKQSEYWGMATFYSKVRMDNPKNANKGGDNTKIGVTENNAKNRQKDFFPESAKTVPAKYLGGSQAQISADEPYRPALAKWMTAPENPFFAKAIVNRTWAHLFGRGFVNPIDDMLEENTPSHPELLDALSRHIGKEGEFDLKYLIKAICLSETYQRTSKPLEDNKTDQSLFSHMTVKVLTPEQLFDSLAQVTGLGRGNAQAAKAKGPRNVGGARTQFVNFFLAGSEATSTIDYEAGIPQALRLMNSQIANNPSAIRTVLGGTTEQTLALERVYLSALSRRPTVEEMKMLKEYAAKSDTKMSALGDILWAALNSSEFTLVR